MSVMVLEGGFLLIMSLHRPCEKCGKRFLPNSYANKLCEDCRKEAHGKWKVKKKLEK